MIDFDTKSATVFYLDYGDIETRPFGRLHSLESAYCTLPFQAFRVAIPHIEPTNPKVGWGTEVVNLMKETLKDKSLSGLVEDKTDFAVCIDIRCPDGEPLSDKLIQKGLARRSVKADTATPPAAVLPETPPRVKRVAPPPKKILRISDLPKSMDIFMGEELDVMVISANSPNDIICQRLDCLEHLTKIMNMSGEYHGYSESYIPTEGEIVACLYDRDAMWYRAEVQKITNQNSIEVRYIDYGNCETVATSHLAKLAEEYHNVPVLGLRTRLSGIGSMVPDAQWQEHLLEKEFKMVIADIEDRILDVEYIHTDTDSSINLFFLNNGFAMPPAAAMATGPSKAKTSPIKRREDMGHIPFPAVGQPTNVRVVDASTPHSITVQPLTNDILKLDTVSDKLQQINADYSGQHKPQQGEVVCAKFSVDQKWYRGETLEVGADKAKILFLDFGNTEDVIFRDINVLQGELLEIPVIAWLCGLVGVRGVVHGVEWNPDSRDIVLFDKVYVLELVTTGPENRLLVKLSDLDTGTVVNDALVENGILLPEAKKDKVPENTEAQAKPVVTPRRDTASPVMTADLPRPGLSLEHLLAVPFSLINEKTIFVHACTKDLEANMTAIQNRLTETYSSASPNESYEPQEGELVAAFNTGDWYRADVFKVGKQYKKARVTLVDYGDECVQEFSSLRRLCPELGKIPRLATRCALLCDTEWSQDALKQLYDIIGNKKMELKVKGMADDVVEIVDLIDKSGNSTLELLQKRGVIKLPTPAPSPDVVMATDIPMVHLPPSQIKVNLVHSVSPDEMYIQLKEEWADAPFITMMSQLNNYCKQLEQQRAPDSLNYSPIPGEVVCSKFDNVWYRAVVQEVSDTHARVLFIDYGNVEAVSLEFVYKLPRESAEIPQQRICCKLHQVRPTDPSGVWPVAANEMLVKHYFVLADLKPTQKRDGAKHLVDFMFENVSITASEMLINAGLAATEITDHRPHASSATAAKHKTDNMAPPPLQRMAAIGPKKSAAAVPTFRLDQLPTLELPQSTDIVVTHVRNPGHFYCHVATTEGEFGPGD